MKYASHYNWRHAEKKGNLTLAAKLLLKEMKFNCDRIPHHLQEYELFTEIFNSFSYVPLLSNVPCDIFDDLKRIREEMKKIINKI